MKETTTWPLIPPRSPTPRMNLPIPCNRRCGSRRSTGARIVNAFVSLDKRITAMEEGEGTTPPINPEPPEGGDSTIPLTWNDARFSGNAQSGATTVASGQTISKKSITETGHTASIISQGGTIDTCRVNSREGVRVASSGTHTIKNSYLEATGTGDDHADTIQHYAPGSRGKLVMSNTSIVAHNQAATAGLFCADNWTGTFELTDVVFQGGPFGCRLHPDTDNPELKIVMCHLGNPWIVDCQEVLYKNRNVYADISGLTVGDFTVPAETHYATKVREMISYVGENHRLLYGSDWPICNMSSYLRFVHKLGLDQEAFNLLMYNNAKSVFRL